MVWNPESLQVLDKYELEQRNHMWISSSGCQSLESHELSQNERGLSSHHLQGALFLWAECVLLSVNEKPVYWIRDTLSIGGSCETGAPRVPEGKDGSFQFTWTITENTHQHGSDQPMVGVVCCSSTNPQWCQNRTPSLQLGFPISASAAWFPHLILKNEGFYQGV